MKILCILICLSNLIVIDDELLRIRPTGGYRKENDEWCRDNVNSGSILYIITFLSVVERAVTDEQGLWMGVWILVYIAWYILGYYGKKWDLRKNNKKVKKNRTPLWLNSSAYRLRITSDTSEIPCQVKNGQNKLFFFLKVLDTSPNRLVYSLCRVRKDTMFKLVTWILEFALKTFVVLWFTLFVSIWSFLFIMDWIYG